jgi:hypothetical protein
MKDQKQTERQSPFEYVVLVLWFDDIASKRNRRGANQDITLNMTEAVGQNFKVAPLNGKSRHNELVVEGPSEGQEHQLQD